MSLESSFPDYQPKRFGLKYAPPMIVLEYLVPSTGKLYHHKMNLKDLNKSTNLHQFFEQIKKKHALYLNTSKIAEDQVMGLIKKLQEKLSEDFNSVDLNKLKPEEVQKYKDKMDEMYKNNFKKPGDPGYKYEIEKSFVSNLEASWDEEEDF